MKLNAGMFRRSGLMLLGLACMIGQAFVDRRSQLDAIDEAVDERFKELEAKSKKDGVQ